MSAVLPVSRAPNREAVLRWLPFAAGWSALYLPTFYYLNETLWNEEEYAHGAIILLAALWIFWQKRAVLLEVADAPVRAIGSITLAFGLICYALGRSQAVIALEVGSIIPVVAGALLFVKGWRALVGLSFPLLFLAFMVPLPGFIMIPLTGPLREYVSVIAEAILRAFDYPIARSGVILHIGAYQLLVANACSGINSMLALAALGLLYLHLMRHQSGWRNAILLASILPIAFAANIVRVVILVLVTYHFGAAAGQGVIHGFSGMALFIIALLMLFALDGLLGAARVWRSRSA